MPYTNVPPDKKDLMDRCVDKVMAKGHDKQSAIAICYTAIVEKECNNLAVIKQTNDKYRWIVTSSSAYKDRDGETISTKALEDDCSRADATGQFGNLLWWHMPELKLGVCDFNAMHGRMLIESGTFDNAKIAEAIKEHASDLGVSIGFTYPEKSDSGVFNVVHRFERSILPVAKASNMFASVDAVVKEDEMRKEKVDKLKELVGEDVVNETLSNAETTQKAADEAGVEFKSAEGESDKATKKVDLPPVDLPPIPPPVGDLLPPPASPAVETQKVTPPTQADTMALGDLSVSDFMGILGDALSAAITPILKKLEEYYAAAGTTKKEIDNRLKELESDVPVAAKSYIASRDAGVGKEALKAALAETIKEARSDDPVVEFLMRGLR